ncbi:MAG: hypothetical protein ACREP9_05090, partial [Candidatus Dormibacteraceae bacterium]
ATQASSGVAGAARNISSIGPRESGYQFGANWLAAATANEKESLISQAPKIPRVLDAQLFQYAELNLGSLQGRETDRHELRAGFWDAIHRNLSPLPAADTDSGEKSSK